MIVLLCLTALAPVCTNVTPGWIALRNHSRGSDIQNLCTIRTGNGDSLIGPDFSQRGDHMVKRKRMGLIRIGGTVLILGVAASLLAEHIEMKQAPLFVIERSTNANVVHYDANIRADGELDPRQPISAYWIMAAVDGHREELTPIEKARAYGYTVEPGRDSKSYHLRLVSQKQRDIAIVREGETIRAEAVIDGRRAWLKKMYVSTHKVLAVPTVKFIDLFGTDLATGEGVSERVMP
jgi:hypothetical protein